MSQHITVLKNLKTPDFTHIFGMLNGSPEPFHHKNKEEGRKRVSLPEASRGTVDF